MDGVFCVVGCVFLKEYNNEIVLKLKGDEKNKLL